MKYFPHRQKSDNPEVVMKGENGKGQETFPCKTITGRYFLVSPSTPNEIFAIQMMEHGREKFAPAKGNGIIVSANALLKLDITN